MRAALYHRVSTLDQNPENARDELRAAARTRGAVVVLDVEETGSGAKNNRPGLQRVMGAARAGQLDAVLVWKLDRFGRSVLDVLANVNELNACGVRFVCTSQGLDIGEGSGAVGRLLLTMLAAVSEFERELTRERTHLALDKARKAGKHIGRPRVILGTDALRRASELRRQMELPRQGGQAPMSWRAVQRALRAERLLLPNAKGKYPSFASVARACTKAHPESERGTPGWARSSR